MERYPSGHKGVDLKSIVAIYTRLVGSNPTRSVNICLIRLVGYGICLPSRNMVGSSPTWDFIWAVRLSARSQPFHGCKMGSIPIPSTVAIAQLAEQRLVVPQVVDSTSTSHLRYPLL